jgi:hypothetical protein
VLGGVPCQGSRISVLTWSSTRATSGASTADWYEVGRNEALLFVEQIYQRSWVRAPDCQAEIRRRGLEPVVRAEVLMDSGSITRASLEELRSELRTIRAADIRSISTGFLFHPDFTLLIGAPGGARWDGQH